MHITPRLINLYVTPDYRVIMIRRLMHAKAALSPRGVAYAKTSVIVIGVKLALALLGVLTLTK